MTDYGQVLAYHYPNYIWTVRANDYNQFDWDASNAIAKPTQAELDALWPGVQSQLQSDADLRDKIDSFQSVYDVQTQLINIMKAIDLNDNTEITNMLAAWESLE